MKLFWRAHKGRQCWCSLLLAVFVIAPLGIFGQGPANNGQVSGLVNGPDGSPVAGALVVLRSNSGSAVEKRADTDKSGHYLFSGLLLGAYRLSVSALGFRDSETKIVFLTSASATADLTLIPLKPGENPKTGSTSPNAAPAFSPAGARGNLAPSGYSTGRGEEETARVAAGANSLDLTVFSTLTGSRADCGQEPVLRRTVEQSPHDFAANHAMGDFYLGHGDYSKALQHLSAARALAPGDFTNSRDLAMAMMGVGRGSDAASLVEQLLAERKSDSTLLRLLAFAYRSAGDNEKASSAFKKAAASDPGIENQYDCGVGLIQLGAPKDALDIFEAGTKAHAESARLWLGLGIAQQLLDHRTEAVSALFRSAEAQPDFLPPLALLAELGTLPEPERALLRRRLSEYVVAHPGNGEAHFSYAMFLFKQAQAEGGSESREEITVQLQRALQLNPKMARAHFLLADLETEARNVPGAIHDFVEGLRLDPNDARAHYRLGLLYRRNGQMELASQEMERFTALHGQTDADNGTAPGVVSLPSFLPAAAQISCSGTPQE